MKVLYAIHAPGNGTISRANELLPILEKYCETDVLLSGKQGQTGLNHFIKYRRKGINFIRGRNGAIDLLKSMHQLKTKSFVEDAASVPVETYDVVINDFEPLTALACKQQNVPCIALSHFYAVLDSTTPKPLKYDPLGWLLMRYFAPASYGVGFHFKAYASNISTPVIRQEIRDAYTRNLGHYTVYLPELPDKKIVKVLSDHKDRQWHIFSAKADKSYAANNCWVRPINNYDFISSSSTCEGILTAAGFETPAEALFMNKKLMVIPMKGNYAQQCNATALKELGVPVLKKFSSKKYRKIQGWLKSSHKIHVDYADNSLKAVHSLITIASLAIHNKSAVLESSPGDSFTDTSLLEEYKNY